MKTITKILSFFFGLAFICALGVGVYFAGVYVTRLFTRMDFQVASVTGIAAAVALFCAMIIASSLRWKDGRGSPQALGAEKMALYQSLVVAFGEALRQQTLEASSPALPEKLQALGQLLILTGSAEVIRAYSALQAAEQEEGLLSPEFSSRLALLIKEMRKDVGLNKENPTDAELLDLLGGKPGKARDRVAITMPPDYRPRVSITPGS
jgi:hypothetical protein